MRKYSNALAFHFENYFLDYVGFPLLSQSGAVAGGQNKLFHSPASLDVPFQIANSGQVVKGRSTRRRQREHRVNFLMFMYSCTEPFWSLQISV